MVCTVESTCLAVGHVAAYEHGFAALVLDSLLDGVTLGLSSGDDGDFRALLGKEVDRPPLRFRCFLR